MRVLNLPFKWISAFALFVMGWKINGKFPELAKYLVVVAPHTSAMDFAIGALVRKTMSIEYVKYTGKKALFDSKFGWYFRWMGGYPIDRSRSENIVQQIVELYNRHDNFALTITPEGTRKRVERLKTGFYFIAKELNVPLVLVGFDYGRKTVAVDMPYHLTEDLEVDFDYVLNFYGDMQGKVPEYDLRHLKGKGKELALDLQNRLQN